MRRTKKKPRGPITPEEKAEIRALSAKRIGQKDIARRLGISVGAVNAAVRKSVNPPESSREPAPPAPDHPEAEVDALPVLARLDRSLAALEQAATLAAGDRDVARMVSVQKAIAQVSALAAKLAPPVPADPNTAPNMVAAAASFRKRVFALWDRLVAEAKVAP
jgi:transposase-like protein